MQNLRHDGWKISKNFEYPKRIEIAASKKNIIGKLELILSMHKMIIAASK